MGFNEFNPHEVMAKLTKENTIIIEHKYTNDIPLTPEQLQAQQDEYDQMQAPTTEPVDFAADREAYLSGRRLRNEIPEEPPSEEPTLF
jgi:L-rhamnose isomerase